MLRIYYVRSKFESGDAGMKYAVVLISILLPMVAFAETVTQTKQLELSSAGIEVLTIRCGAGFLNIQSSDPSEKINVKADIQIEIGQIENIQGIKIYLLLVLSIAIIPNLCQFWVSGPGFGGMSGVNYGLLGYIWIRGKFDPLSGLRIENYLIVWMMVWFFLGLTGLIGAIANTVHGVGLVVGMAWGYILARINPHLRNR